MKPLAPANCVGDTLRPKTQPFHARRRGASIPIYHLSVDVEQVDPIQKNIGMEKHKKRRRVQTEEKIIGMSSREYLKTISKSHNFNCLYFVRYSHDEHKHLSIYFQQSQLPTTQINYPPICVVSIEIRNPPLQLQGNLRPS